MARKKVTLAELDTVIDVTVPEFEFNLDLAAQKLDEVEAFVAYRNEMIRRYEANKPIIMAIKEKQRELEERRYAMLVRENSPVKILQNRKENIEKQVRDIPEGHPVHAMLSIARKEIQGEINRRLDTLTRQVGKEIDELHAQLDIEAMEFHDQEERLRQKAAQKTKVQMKEVARK